MSKQWMSEGNGLCCWKDLKACGENVIIEDGVRIFHPENIIIGDNVYIGHDTILKGYHNSLLIIGSNSWIGQMCFIHGAGGVTIGQNVGIGPMVKIHGARHKEKGIEVPLLFTELEYGQIIINNDCNIGIGAVIMSGVSIGVGAKIGANAVVNRDIPDYSVAVGVPVKVIKIRN